jgi:hypothetical protein
MISSVPYTQPPPTRRKRLDKIFVYASRLDEHRRVFHLLGDLRPGLLNL